MIYPYSLPPEVKSHAEKTMFTQFSQIKEEYDIFYSKSFLSKYDNEKREYEIDFIVVKKPDRKTKCDVILCIEVKGGILEYDGENNIWLQNGHPLIKDPIRQASSSAHSLLKRYSDLGKEVIIEWALCFPDCELPENIVLPPNINKNRIIDKRGVLYIGEVIESMIEQIKTGYDKPGCTNHVYESFKISLLRSIGFIETLSTKFKYEETRFLELTNEQLQFFNQLLDNKNIKVSGFAGSGKTVIAIAAAQEYLSRCETVLFMCYNRTLANKIRYRFDKYDKNIKVVTFHSLAKAIIDKYDSQWFKNQSNKNEESFWDIEVPIKLSSAMISYKHQFDTIIIDEGQDFKELWFELIFKLGKNNGNKYIFTDPMQDIFQRCCTIPNESGFFKYNLKKNCRNTKNIVSFLETVVNKDIQVHDSSPTGEEITESTFNTTKDLIVGLTKEIKLLINSHGLSTNQILIMVNSRKKDSSINETAKIGKYPLKKLNRSGRFDRDTIHYSSIKQFKGLEIDVLFIIDIHLLKDSKTVYTQISRGKNKIYLFNLA